MLVMSPVVVCYYLCLFGAYAPGTWRLMLTWRDLMTFHQHSVPGSASRLGSSLLALTHFHLITLLPIVPWCAIKQ